MNMESRGRKGFLSSLKNCFSGLNYTIVHEKNFNIILILGIIVLLSSFIFEISKMEFLVILLLINFVIIMELINTALERVVDLYTTKYNELAKAVKDIAAASVLVMSLFSAIIGLIIFIPRIMEWLR